MTSPSLRDLSALQSLERTLPLGLFFTAERIEVVGNALQTALDTQPNGHPNFPGWVQRVFAGGASSVVEAIVLLHLAALLQRLLAQPRVRWTEAALETALGVALSLYTVDSECVPLGEVLEEALDRQGGPVGGSALFPAELPHAALELLTLADRNGLQMPNAFLEGPLPVFLDVLEQQTSVVLVPDVTSATGSRATRFLQRLDSAQILAPGTSCPELSLREVVTLASTLALWVETRHLIPGLDVTDLLHWAATVTHAGLTVCARQGWPQHELKALLAELHELHREAGRPPLQMYRPGATAPAHRAVMRNAWHALRRAKHVAVGRATARSRGIDAMLWEVFDSLHDRPQPLGEQDQVILTLAARWAVTASPRCVGMALPDTVELACDLSGVDPLWAWPPRDRDTELTLSEALKVAVATWMVWTPEQRDPALGQVLHAVTGHLLAVARRQGIHLPEGPVLEGWLREAGVTTPLRALPLAGDALAQRVTQYLEMMRGWLAHPGPEPVGAAEAVEDEAAPVLTALREVSPSALPEPAWPPHVLEARALLSGKRVVLLGGVPYPEHHQALMNALELGELDWIPSSRYDHGLQAIAHVRQPGTALVIFALRWGAHAHGSLREAARACGVPYLLHPAGLNPSQVAWQVMQQVSGALKAQAS